MCTWPHASNTAYYSHPAPEIEFSSPAHVVLLWQKAYASQFIFTTVSWIERYYYPYFLNENSGEIKI